MTTLFLFSSAWALFFLWRSGAGLRAVAACALLGALHLVLQGNGFYARTDTMPPRAVLLLAPSVLIILAVLARPAGRKWMRSLDLGALTLLHTCRVGVEWVLHQAWLDGQVPRTMTFEGTNFDIVSGLSAPLVWAYLRYSKSPQHWVLPVWNLLCLALLVNIVITAVLSLPGPMQVLNHVMPNRLVLTGPYVLLPAVVVPVVLFAHLCVLLRPRSVADR